MPNNQISTKSLASLYGYWTNSVIYDLRNLSTRVGQKAVIHSDCHRDGS